MLNCIGFKQQHGKLLSVSTCELYDMFFRQFSSSYAFRHLSNFPVFSTAISTQSSGGPMQTDILHTAHIGAKNILQFAVQILIPQALYYCPWMLICMVLCYVVFRSRKKTAHGKNALHEVSKILAKSTSNPRILEIQVKSASNLYQIR